MIDCFRFFTTAGRRNLTEEIRPLLIVAFGKPAEEIHLVDVPEDGNTNYYRDENDVHYVPKRTLADELLN